MPDLYKDKIPWIMPYVAGRKVLDLGCVRHDLKETEKADWLHGHLKQQAKYLVGVDYLEEETAALRARGYNVLHANVETMDLGDEFEVIVAGDLIEHLNNFGMFLDRVSAHLAPEGTFLLTTPNPINPMRFFQVLFLGRTLSNREHTCWFTPEVLGQLLRRYNLEIVQVAYVDDTYQYYKHIVKWWPFLALNFLACRLRRQFAETLCFAIRKIRPSPSVTGNSAG